MILIIRTWTSRHTRWVCLLAVATLAGCAGTKQRDVLESRLRHQEDMLSSYQSQIDRAKTELDIARREATSLREQLAQNADVAVPPEPFDASFRAASLEFSTLMTGGTNLNRTPGDDGLTIVLLPRDLDGGVVKVAGTIEIEAFDLAGAEGAQRIGHWKFDASESHEYWHQGIIQSGYQFELPWQDAPLSEKVLLHGRLISIDGRQFDTTHTISVNPPDPSLAGRDTADVAGRSSIKQLSTSEESDSFIRQADVQTVQAPERNAFASPQTPGANPFGHSRLRRPRISDARAMTGQEFKDRLSVTNPLTVGSTTSSTIQPLRSATTPPLPTEIRELIKSPLRRSVAPSDNGEPRPFPVDLSGTSDFAREIPPPIRDVPDDTGDWPSADDWPHANQRQPVRTSDSWTDETIPYLR